jgi:hypothetical protein
VTEGPKQQRAQEQQQGQEQQQEPNQQQGQERPPNKQQRQKINVLDFLKGYYNDIAKGSFKAEVYFSKSVDQYIQKKNTNPAEINAIHRNNNEFLNAQSVIINNEIDFSHSNGGVDYYNYIINFTCYRASKKKKQFCKVKVEVGIDQENKIKSYREIEVYDLKFE